MKIISCNVNGIRSAYKKGLVNFIKTENPEIICLQEIKANREDFPTEISELPGYNLYINPASKKGYSGTAIFSKVEPATISTSLGLQRFDSEGRLLELKFKNFSLLNIYIPHGGRQKENLDYKLDVYKRLIAKLESLKDEKVIVVGDFNIAHREIDLARPSQNLNNIMFSPLERIQIDKIISLEFEDSFRYINSESGNYTWWPYAFNAKERNMGWRIDYAFVSKKLSTKLTKVSIYPNVIFSDHCPIGLELSD